MQTTTDLPAGADQPAPPSVHDVRPAVPVEELAELRAVVAEVERLQARAVALAGRVASSGAAEHHEGLPLELVLAADVGMTGADRWTLVTAGQVLETMPGLAGAHQSGQVSWGVVRHVVRLVRRRRLEDRGVLDARITDTLAEARRDRRRLDPDELCAAVDAAANELDDRRANERREEAARLANRLWVQPGLDGRVHGGFDYDPVAGALVLEALAAQQGTPSSDDPDRAPEEPSLQQRSQAQALVDLCAQALAGGQGRRARPLYIVDVAARDIDQTHPGRLRLRLPGAPRRVTAKRLAADAASGASVRVVVTDGEAPQAVSGVVRTDAAGLDTDLTGQLVRSLAIPGGQRDGLSLLLAAVNAALNHPDATRAVVDGDRPLIDASHLSADDIPAATRMAVLHRDQGCRFFGCDAPVAWCEVHHLIPREDGGDHHPDRLVALCRRCHGLVHRHRWNLSLDPATAVLTGRRRDRVWRTRPRGSPLAPARPPPP